MMLGHKNATDEELTDEAKVGSLSSFEELLNRYEKRIYCFLYQRTGNSHDAEDLTQQTFIRAYQKLDLFNKKYKFGVWLYTLARNISNDYHRSRRHHLELPEAPEQADYRTPSTVLENRDEANSIWDKAREDLSESQYTALWLKYMEEMSIKQMAEVMKLSVANIKVTLHRARKQIAPLVEKGAFKQHEM